MTYKELLEFHALELEAKLGMERLVAAVSDDDANNRATLERRIRQNRDRREEITEYINAIPDSFTRLIFVLRFCEGLNWRKIAVTVGGGNTPESLRKRVSRHIKRHQGKCATNA